MILGQLLLRCARHVLPLQMMFVPLQIPALARGESIRSWKDLSPAMPDLRAPYRRLSDDPVAQLFKLYELAHWGKSAQAANHLVLVKLSESFKVDVRCDADWLTSRLRVVRNDCRQENWESAGRDVSAYELEGMSIVPYH